MGPRKDAETLRRKDQEIEKLQHDLAQLASEYQKLHSELLQERITRIDFQVNLLNQWRQRCQEELNHLLAGQGHNSVQDELAKTSGKVSG